MPKFIRFAGEYILNAAKTRMVSNKKKDLSLRNVADDCGIAVGTIYNYYANKDDLVTAVIIKEWEHQLGKVEPRILKASTISEGMEAIYDAVIRLRRIFRRYWEINYDAASAKEAVELHREDFINLLMQAVERVLSRFMDDYRRADARMIAELISASAIQNINKNDFAGFFRLIKTSR